MLTAIHARCAPPRSRARGRVPRLAPKNAAHAERDRPLAVLRRPHLFGLASRAPQARARVLFLLAASTLGVTPAETVVVEDSTRGVKAALAAGMRILGYTASVGRPAIIAAGAEPVDDLALVPTMLGL